MSQPAHRLATMASSERRCPAWLRQPALLPLGLGLAALATVALFDLGPALPFNDDWGMAWSARQFIVGHHLRIFPVQSALALVQTFVSALLLFGHTDQRLLRLSVIPFVVLAAISTYRVARGLGAGGFWSSVAAVSLLGAPLYLTSATTYMSDVPYVGLLMAAAAAGFRWIKNGEARLQCVAWAALCPLERQLGVMVPAAITIGLLAASRHRSLNRRDWIWLGALWFAAAAAAIVPVVAGIAPPTQANRVANIVHVSLERAALPLVYFPAMLGLLLMPFAAGLLCNRPDRHQQLRRRTGVERIVALALLSFSVAGVVSSVIGLLGARLMFPGDVFTELGFTPVLLGSKTSPFPAPVFLCFELLSIASFILVLRARLWRLSTLDATAILLLAVSASQLLPLVLLQTPLFDRYYLPVLAPLLPLLALRASTVRQQFLAASWAIGCVLLGLGLYVVGEQDYEAWQMARSSAASLAFAEYPPDQVDAGYEANALAVEIPAYDRSGTILGGLARSSFDPDYASTGPAHPRIRLEFAPSGDPRPGVDYHSLTASGRIVLVRP